MLLEHSYQIQPYLRKIVTSFDLEYHHLAQQMIGMVYHLLRQ